MPPSSDSSLRSAAALQRRGQRVALRRSGYPSSVMRSNELAHRTRSIPMRACSWASPEARAEAERFARARSVGWPPPSQIAVCTQAASSNARVCVAPSFSARRALWRPTARALVGVVAREPPRARRSGGGLLQAPRLALDDPTAFHLVDGIARAAATASASPASSRELEQHRLDQSCEARSATRRDFRGVRNGSRGPSWSTSSRANAASASALRQGIGPCGDFRGLLRPAPG